MTNKQLLVAAAAVAALTTLLLIPQLLSGATPAVAPEPVVERPKLTHQQEVWVSALEWCESRGVNSAVNEVDLDGTPSYYAFQFKPSTFDYYAEMFGVEGTIDDYEAQKELVTQMVLHRDKINWHQQFPDCVRKNGVPPKA